MLRTLLIAKRDYLQMVQSKAYLVGLILLPLLFGGGFFVLPLANRGGPKDLRVAVLDGTGVAGAAVIESAQEINRRARSDTSFGSPSAPRYSFEEVKPESDLAAQLLSLSDRVRSGELSLVVEISPEALQPPSHPNRPLARYYSNSGGIVDQQNFWVPAAVNNGLRRVRLTQLGIDPARVPGVLDDIGVVPMDLVSKNPATGNVVEGRKKSPIQTGAVPFFLVFLLYIIAIFGSAPNLGAVAQDKMQRVYEMLLSSASPFELMMGKVFAAVGASLTSSTVYIIGGLLALAGMATLGAAPLHLIPWFFVYVFADVFMLAAVGVALGSACATPQDAQQFAFLLILPLMIPMFVLAPIMQQPNGGLAVVMSFIPPLTPIVMLLRQSMPAGVPWWQPWVSLVGIVAWATATIWVAARIFRIGILSQGKTPQIGELAKWVLRD